MNRNQAPVVQTLDSATHRINQYSADMHWENQSRHPADSDIQRFNNLGQDNKLRAMDSESSKKKKLHNYVTTQ